jgi:hypothetical protein
VSPRYFDHIFHVSTVVVSNSGYVLRITANRERLIPSMHCGIAHASLIISAQHIVDLPLRIAPKINLKNDLSSWNNFAVGSGLYNFWPILMLPSALIQTDCAVGVGL